MTEIATIVNDYIAAWNEADPSRRRELVARVFAGDATYVDPLLSGEGHDGIDAMIAAAQQQFPATRFELVQGPDAHHDRVRFAWQLRPAEGGDALAVGYDYATLAGDGRLREVTGFLEQPAG
jgi:SnoaL-like domain